MINNFKITVPKTANIYSIGDLEKSDKILIVLHGYGQLAKYFVNKFESLIGLGYAIIAPEGLSKFYINGTSGRVGSSWMTKDDRESEIIDQITYINKIAEIFKDKKLILLGFSQGGATAQRCYNYNFQKLLLCSCSLNEGQIFDNKTIYIYGDNDEFIDHDSIKLIKSNIKHLIKFTGKHEINIEAIKKGLLM